MWQPLRRLRQAFCRHEHYDHVMDRVTGRGVSARYWERQPLGPDGAMIRMLVCEKCGDAVRAINRPDDEQQRILEVGAVRSPFAVRALLRRRRKLPRNVVPIRKAR